MLKLVNNQQLFLHLTTILKSFIIAKNVVLAGVKSVTLYDPTPVEITDLSAQVSEKFTLYLQNIHSLSSFISLNKILVNLVPRSVNPSWLN